MFEINNQSDKLMIVVHEIYGMNQHMVDVCEFLSEQDYDVICPNLLEHDFPFDYSQEEKAYRHFMDHVGFINAVHKIRDLILANQHEYSKIYIIGFSVGATVAWLCSEEESVDGIAGFYGSRIRDYININPKCPALLFFPTVEHSFHVDELVSTLDQPNVELHICKGEHGFCDPYSSKYNEELAQQKFSKTLEFFGNL
ncbi:dienelactone hydrolase family protein [Ureibacillus sp. GCM10028918]|uniref:dienelactone hydrolase family protein n=1 Tax=Ureibacillus sp. GCM10028918 TaxID=3273429 RepID=UPI003619A56B